VAVSVRIKRPQCEVEHSPPSIAEVKNTWGICLDCPYEFSLT
jgi:hypothetical protein